MLPNLLATDVAYHPVAPVENYDHSADFKGNGSRTYRQWDRDCKQVAQDKKTWNNIFFFGAGGRGGAVASQNYIRKT